MVAKKSEQASEPKPMSPSEHYREAERIVRWVDGLEVGLSGGYLNPMEFESMRLLVQSSLIRAQVHATLATVARGTFEEAVRAQVLDPSVSFKKERED